VIFWLTATDGSVNFKCEAVDAGQAFELMARSLRYNSFAAFSADLGYTPGDFRVAMLEVEPPVEYDEAGNRRMIDQQRDTTVTNAFKALRRLGRG
jgi:hypothetical protein